jgi:hypothetical protein
LLRELVEFFAEKRLRGFVYPRLIDDCEHHLWRSLVLLITTWRYRNDEDTNCSENDTASPLEMKVQRPDQSNGDTRAQLLHWFSGSR